MGQSRFEIRFCEACGRSTKHYLSNDRCRCCYRRQRHAECPEATRVQQARWRETKPEHDLLRNCRARAKRGGFCCTLTLEWIRANTLNCCPVTTCGVRLARNSKSPGDASPTIDRVRTELGYTEENSRIICHGCNRRKSDSTPEQLRGLADYMESNDSRWLALSGEFVPKKAAA